MRRAAPDESEKWTYFSTHYEDCDGQVQLMQGLHIDFQKRVAHEHWKSGARYLRKSWKMDYECNNETRSLNDLFWNTAQMKAFLTWRIAPIEHRKKKLKVATITTLNELDKVETIAWSE